MSRRLSPRRTLLLACAVSLAAHGVLFGALSRLRAPHLPNIAEKFFAVNLAPLKQLSPTPKPPTPRVTPPRVRSMLRRPSQPHEAAPPKRRTMPLAAVPNATRSTATNRTTSKPRAVSSAGLFTPSGDAPPDNTPRLPAASGMAAPRAVSAPPESESSLPGAAPRQFVVEFNTRNAAAPRQESEPPDATPGSNDVREPVAPRGPRKIRRSEAPEVETPARPSSNPEPLPRPAAHPEPHPQPQPVSETFHRARAIAEPKPDYPAEARARNQEGSVQMRLEINANGDVTGVTVTQSSGHAALDEAAQRAARRWKYHPARRGETPVASSITRTLKWTLED